MKELFAYTGGDAGEIPARLAAPFTDTKAYKGVPGGTDLTDINTGFMLERVTEIFDLKGLGWNFTFKPEHLLVREAGSRVNAIDWPGSPYSVGVKPAP